MKKLYKSAFCEVELDAAASFLQLTYNPKTYEMSEKEYKYDLEEYYKLLVRHQPLRTLSDMTFFYFTIAPDVQAWVNELFAKLPNEVSPQAHARSAIVMSTDIFAQVSLEQTLEDSTITTQAPNLRHFPNREEAVSWLMA
jgi:hypothetical protein